MKMISKRFIIIYNSFCISAFTIIYVITLILFFVYFKQTNKDLYIIHETKDNRYI